MTKTKTTINITFENIEIPFLKKWFKQKISEILDLLNLVEPVELSLLITDDEKMRMLNREYRKIDDTTDVLSFSLIDSQEGRSNVGFALPPDVPIQVGEVVISYPQAEKQSKDFKLNIEEELTILLVHGVLHLFGYDHELARDMKKMQNKEREIISYLKRYKV